MPRLRYQGSPGWYISIYFPEHPDSNQLGYIKEHRLVMERKLGRRLSSYEVVHHKDGNRENNHPDNLILCDGASEHMHFHREIPRKPKDIWSDFFRDFLFTKYPCLLELHGLPDWEMDPEYYFEEINLFNFDFERVAMIFL